ncbi:hypothetical protein TWF594_006723 [Orbilia oligospora]|nr:hypothetical protein TWF103_009187 [Orbilia oligospora]KAF3139433.1 hypothetical protein TWF594_006723 [Orbilia oligospora]
MLANSSVANLRTTNESAGAETKRDSKIEERTLTNRFLFENPAGNLPPQHAINIRGLAGLPPPWSQILLVISTIKVTSPFYGLVCPAANGVRWGQQRTNPQFCFSARCSTAHLTIRPCLL